MTRLLLLMMLLLFVIVLMRLAYEGAWIDIGGLILGVFMYRDEVKKLWDEREDNYE